MNSVWNFWRKKGEIEIQKTKKDKPHMAQIFLRYFSSKAYSYVEPDTGPNAVRFSAPEEKLPSKCFRLFKMFHFLCIFETPLMQSCSFPLIWPGDSQGPIHTTTSLLSLNTNRDADQLWANMSFQNHLHTFIIKSIMILYLFNYYNSSLMFIHAS